MELSLNFLEFQKIKDEMCSVDKLAWVNYRSSEHFKQ